MRITKRCLHHLSLLLVALSSSSPSVAAAAAAPQKTWTLHHAVLSENHSEPQFVPRGKLILSIQEAPEDKKKETEGPLHAVLEHDENALSNEMLQQLLTPGAWYQLKLVDDANSKHQVITTVPACHVRRSNFRDELVVSLGSTSAQILSISYMPLISPLAPATCDAYSTDDEDASKQQFQFESRVSVETAIPGMTLRNVLPEYQPPAGLHMLSSKQSLKDAGGDGSQQQQQQEPVDNTPFGFIKRYWYILLPLFLSQFISAEPPASQQQQQQGGQQPSGGGAGQQAPAATTSSGAEGGAVRRRGKRGKP